MAISVEEHKIVPYICVFYIDLHCFWINSRNSSESSTESLHF